MRSLNSMGWLSAHEAWALYTVITLACPILPAQKDELDTSEVDVLPMLSIRSSSQPTLHSR